MSETALIALALLAALAYGILHAGHDTPSWRATGIKTASTAFLTLAGWMLGAPGWIVLGLGLGALGDYALSRRGTASFLAGMAAFALGHLAYAVWFVARAQGVAPLVWPVLAAMIALSVLTALWIAPRAGALAWPVRGYALVIGAMVVAAAALPEVPGRAVMLAGVALFAASDLILALRLFVLKGNALRLIAARVLWPLYWGGQALILAGALN